MTAPSSPPAAAPVVAAQRRRFRRSWLERIVIATGVTSTLLALFAAGLLAMVKESVDDITTVEMAAVVEAAEPGEPSNWLLVGSDSREGIEADDPNADIFLGEETPAGKRTDTMIVARVDPESGIIDLLSIPRDLYVPIAGTGNESRINSAFNGEGGEERLVETIENYFGFEINHYAEINFVGFQEVVDALGGVPIWFDQPMRDAGSGLDISSAGCHVLTGSQALAFARGRNVQFFSNGRWQLDGTGDLGRTSRQQYFVRRVAATATKSLDITSLGTITSIIDAGGENLVIDGGVGLGDLVELAKTFASVSDDQIIGHSLPVYDFRAPNNAAVLGMSSAEAQPILAIFRGEDPATVTSTQPVQTYTYRVLNGSRVSGQASEVAALLGAAGFVVDSVDNAPSTDRTTIRYAAGAEGAASQLARHLVVEPVFELDESIDDVVLVTGTDFDGIRDEPLPEGSVQAPTPTTAPPADAPAPAAVEADAPGVVPGPTPEGTACG